MNKVQLGSTSFGHLEGGRGGKEERSFLLFLKSRSSRSTLTDAALRGCYSSVILMPFLSIHHCIPLLPFSISPSLLFEITMRFCWIYYALTWPIPLLPIPLKGATTWLPYTIHLRLSCADLRTSGRRVCSLAALRFLRFSISFSTFPAPIF